MECLTSCILLTKVLYFLKYLWFGLIPLSTTLFCLICMSETLFCVCIIFVKLSKLYPKNIIWTVIRLKNICRYYHFFLNKWSRLDVNFFIPLLKLAKLRFEPLKTIIHHGYERVSANSDTIHNFLHFYHIKNLTWKLNHHLCHVFKVITFEFHPLSWW